MAPFTLEDFFTDDQIEDSLNFEATTDVLLGGSDTNSVRSPSSVKKNSRKWKLEEVLESMLDVMTKIHENTSDLLQTLSSRIGYDTIAVDEEEKQGIPVYNPKI